MLYNYSVTPLKADHFEERVADIIDLYHKKVITMPLFSMTLVPEGNPVWDKVGPMVRLLKQYKTALEQAQVPVGVLVQASLGHGYVIEPNPFTKYENLTDGAKQFVCCPMDEDFLAHFKDVLRQIAAAHPKAIMLDDDFRMVIRPGLGCVCPLHLAAFNRRTGKNFTKDQLREHVLTHPKNDVLTEIFSDTQRDALIHAAKEFRAAVDEIDPSIQGINCTSGHYCDSVIYTNSHFAGKGNPTMVRVPNGIYAPNSVREFSDLMRQAAICKSRLQKHGIEIVLAETDTIPFNRYGKGARHLHAHYVASLLEGLKGAKHWLSRGTAWEPASGKAYRKILAEHTGMYEKLATLADGIQWLGINSAFIEQEKFVFSPDQSRRYHENNFVIKNLERMGLPFYFAEEHTALSILEGRLVEDMSDAQIEAAFNASVFVDGIAAETLVHRGYGHLLGVSVSEWDGRRISGECFDEAGTVGCTAQKDRRLLKINDDRTCTLSYNYVNEQMKAKLLSPAVTLKEREDGKLSVVFCGSPTAEFKYTEGFAFLNESRKKQLVGLMKKAGALPVYFPGDEEICLRAGRLPQRELLISLYNLGYDPVERLLLYFEKEPAVLKMMLPNGHLQKVAFNQCKGNIYELDVHIQPLCPMILIAK